MTVEADARAHLPETPDAPAPLQLRIDPRRALGYALAAIVLLAVGNVLAVALSATPGPPSAAARLAARALLLDAEANVPTIYAVLQLVGCAALFGVVALVERADPGGRQAGRWALLALVTAFLAFDEAAAFHERLSDPLRDALDLGGVLGFAWVLPYAALTLLLGIAYLPWLRALPAWTRRWILAAGAVYVTGAVGLEMVGALIAETTGGATLAFLLVASVEELLELLGVALLGYALLAHLQRRLAGRTLQVAASTPSTRPPPGP